MVLFIESRVRQFFTKYNIIWTENGSVIDCFITEILTFKECSKRFQRVWNSCWTRFEHTLNVHISGRKRSIKFSFSGHIMFINTYLFARLHKYIAK